MNDRVEAYSPDRSLKGKLRRRLVRAVARRPARMRLDRPMLSFSFDDPTASACRVGAELLTAHGLRGTYFVATALADREGPMGRYASRDEIAALADHGHEIACHTFSHLDCGQATAATIGDDVDRNARQLNAWGLPPPVSFAYPFGDVSSAAKQVLGYRFGLLRALHRGVLHDGGDLNQVPAVGIEGADGEQRALNWLRRAAAGRGWLFLYTHDVAATPSPWGCTPSALQRLIEAACAAGFEIVTVADGLRRVST